MRLAYFTNEIPYPANHGGRVDTWSRMQAMHAAGAHMALVTWHSAADHPLPASTKQMLGEITTAQVHFLIGSSWPARLRRLVQLARWPSQVASHVPSSTEQSSLWAQLDAFKPEAVWLDALYGTVLARQCAQRYDIPVFYRSHNIEHRYMRSQLARATRWRDRIAIGMNLPHLKAVEFETLRNVHTSFDISKEDLAWWQHQGIEHVQWLPPTMPLDKASRLSANWTVEPNFDVGYLGNLRTPNNVEGVLWFLQRVWPLFKAKRPQASMLLAGSQPAQAVREAVADAHDIQLVENAPDAVDVLRSAKVLINPVFGGSGVNIKSVEMLFAPGRRVATSQGVAGLPAHVQRCFQVADAPEAFAQGIVSALSMPPWDATDPDLMAARGEFDVGKIREILAYMRQVCSGLTVSR